MMSGPARYLGRIPEVGGLPRRATAFYDGELFALTYRRISLSNFPASSLTQSLSHSENLLLSPVCVMSARWLLFTLPIRLPPPDRRHLNRRQLDGPRGVVIANVPLHYLRASPVRTRCKIHGRGNCFSVRWYDLPSTTTSLLFLSASTTAAQRAAVDVNRQQERGEQAPRSPFPFILFLVFFFFVGGSTGKQHTCFWTPSHAYTLTRPVKRCCRASKLTSYFLFLVSVRENGASGQLNTGHRCVAPLRRSPV